MLFPHLMLYYLTILLPIFIAFIVVVPLTYSFDIIPSNVALF